MHIAHLARAENELLAPALEDKLRFVFREHVRGAVVLLRQLLLPLHHLAGEANDHVVLIGLSVNRDGAECGPFDLHGLILVPGLRTRLLTPMSSLRCHRCRLKALGSRRSQTPDGSTSFRPQTQLYSMRRREWSRPAKSMIPCSWADVPKAKVLLDDRCTGGPAATDGVLWRRPGAPAIGAAHTVLVGKSRPVVCRRRVGALGWPSSSRRRNIEQSPQYGPHLLTVRKHGAAIMRASGDAATPTPGEAGETAYPQKPVFASADAMQRYRWVPDPRCRSRS